MSLQAAIKKENKASGQLNLKKMVSELVAGLLSQAVSHNSFFINEVPDDITYPESNAVILTGTIKNLLCTVLNHTEKSCIRISAGAYGGIAFMTIHESDGIHNPQQVALEIHGMQQLAKTIGGCISLVRQPVIAPCIAFSFPNKAIPAA